MDDVLKRLGLVESSVSEIRTQVTGIAAVLPHLATKSDLTEQVGLLRTDLTEQVGLLRTDLTEQVGLLRTDLTGQVGLLRTDLTGQVGLLRTDLTGQVGSLRADLTEKIGLLENRIVKWTIGIIIAVSGLAFTIGKYGH